MEGFFTLEIGLNEIWMDIPRYVVIVYGTNIYKLEKE